MPDAIRPMRRRSPGGDQDHAHDEAEDGAQRPAGEDQPGSHGGAAKPMLTTPMSIKTAIAMARSESFTTSAPMSGMSRLNSPRAAAPTAVTASGTTGTNR